MTDENTAAPDPYLKATRAELAEALRDRERRINNLEVRLAQHEAIRSRDEIEGLGACMSVLESIRLSGGAPAPNRGAIRRVLRYCAERFDLDLFEIRHEPCDRKHADSVEVLVDGQPVWR